MVAPWDDLRQHAVAGPDTTTSATTPTAVGVCMFDFGSIRLARRRHLLQRRMVPARDGVCRVTEPAITTSATSATPPTAVGVCMFDFGSIRLARRWHLLQRWLVPAGDGVRLHTDTDTAPAASTVGQCFLHDSGSVRLAGGGTCCSGGWFPPGMACRAS